MDAVIDINDVICFIGAIGGIDMAVVLKSWRLV